MRQILGDKEIILENFLLFRKNRPFWLVQVKNWQTGLLLSNKQYFAYGEAKQAYYGHIVDEYFENWDLWC